MKDYREFAPSFLPTSAVLELTYKCNHRCLFCSCPWENKKGGYLAGRELTYNEWINCIGKLVKMGVKNISYTGGEPLLNNNIKEIIQYTSSLKISDGVNAKSPNQFLISNGQLIDEGFMYFLKENNIRLSLSLPGLKTYNHHTKNGEYKKILSHFELAKKIGIQTTVNITVTKINLFELYETISRAFLSGADSLLLNRFLPGGRGLEYKDDLFLDAEETLKMLDIAEDVLCRASRYGNLGTELPFCLIKNQSYSNLKVGTRCSAAVGFFVVGPEGNIRTCNHSPIKLSHFSNIDSLKMDAYWKMFAVKNYLPEDCRKCSMTNLCDGGCREAAHVYSNCPNDVDPVFLLK